jgi:hypothetical protein
MASSAAEAAGRVADDHDGWASDGEVDMEMEAGGEAHGRDAGRRDGGADEVDDAYSLVSVTSVPAVGMWVPLFFWTSQIRGGRRVMALLVLWID